MADNTHVYVGVAATVGMEHAGALGGIFRQAPGDKGWEHLTNGLAGDHDDVPVEQLDSTTSDLGRDEIGRVGRAFDAARRTAVEAAVG